MFLGHSYYSWTHDKLPLIPFEVSIMFFWWHQAISIPLGSDSISWTPGLSNTEASSRCQEQSPSSKPLCRTWAELSFSCSEVSIGRKPYVHIFVVYFCLPGTISGIFHFGITFSPSGSFQESSWVSANIFTFCVEPVGSFLSSYSYTWPASVMEFLVVNLTSSRSN